MAARWRGAVAGRWRGGDWTVPGLWRGGGGTVPGLRLLKAFLPDSVVSLSPDTALCALSHNSSVVCLSYSVVFLVSPVSRGTPLPPSVYTPKGLRTVSTN